MASVVRNGLAGSVGGPSSKKLVVKPFKVKPRLPENFEEENWAKLQSAVQAVFKREPIGYSEEELYRAVEDMCLHKLEQAVYSRLEAECNTHIAARLHALETEVRDATGGAAPEDAGRCEAVLQLVDAAWQEHCQAMNTIRNFFLFLDRTFVLQSHVRSLWDMGLQLFRMRLEAARSVAPIAASAILTLVDAERSGQGVPHLLLNHAVRMLCSLKLYGPMLEAPLEERALRFYDGESLRLLEGGCSLPEYLKQAADRLGQEEARTERYLDMASRRALTGAVRQQMVREHVGALIERGFSQLVDQGRTGDVALMHRLFGEVGALDELKQAWGTCIKSLGASLLAQQDEDATAGAGQVSTASQVAGRVVGSLLDFKGRVDGLLTGALGSADAFAVALKEAFEAVLNTGPGGANRAAQLLAKYADELLRTGGLGKGMGDAELDSTLGRLMSLFRYLSAKDVFDAFYKKDLAKRLLLAKSASADAERTMIARLKEECGTAFTSKLEGMFRDMDLSRDVLEKFAQRGESRELGLEFSCHVLTSGTWPHYATCPDLRYPAAAARAQEAFKAFYLGRHSGRSLAWITSLGQCVVRANFRAKLSIKDAASPEGPQSDVPMADGQASGSAAAAAASGPRGPGRHELQVSQYQAVLLLLFNEADELTVEQIQQATNIGIDDLYRTVQSLCLHKTNKPLLKNPPGREVAPSDRVSVNTGFTNKLYRIVINQIQAKETKEEAEQTEARVFEDRQYSVDAAIVRIMKYRKKLSHTLLLAELFQQLAFPCRAADVKKRIESLIEREYLERDPEDVNTYNYLA